MRIRVIHNQNSISCKKAQIEFPVLLKRFKLEVIASYIYSFIFFLISNDMNFFSEKRPIQRSRLAEKLLTWVYCSQHGDTSCHTNCNSFGPRRCTDKDGISYNSQQPWYIHLYRCRRGIPLIAILDGQCFDKQYSRYD